MIRIVLIVLSALIAPTFAIVDGFPARHLQFPYLASLKVISPFDISYCGGSIITNQHILTAAHCAVAPVDEIHVRLGSTRLKEGGVVYKVWASNFIVHPDFGPNTLYNDIAVLKLPTTIKFTSAIQPINLPPKNVAHHSFHGMTGRVGGWGYTNEVHGPYADHLQFVDMRILPNSQCRPFFPKTQRIQANIMCAYGANSDLTLGQKQGLSHKIYVYID